MSDKAIKAKATKLEHKRVFDNFSLPPKDIYAQCSDGLWVRRAWTIVSTFGWDKWEKL
jgi:hypothetical protein